MTNKYEILAEWFKNYEPLEDWLYFNVTNYESGNASLNSISGSRKLIEYIDGTCECELLFSVDLIKDYDTGTSDLNLTALKECLTMMEWCEKQLPPSFPDCVVNEVEILDNAPELSVDNDSGLAKYQILGKVNYLDLTGGK